MNLDKNKINQDFFSEDLYYGILSLNLLVREVQMSKFVDNAKLLAIACSVAKGDEEVFVIAAKTQLQVERAGGVSNFVTLATSILSYDPEILETIKFQTEFSYTENKKTTMEAYGIRQDFKDSFIQFLDKETERRPNKIRLEEVINIYSSYPYMTSEEVIIGGATLGRLINSNFKE